MFFTITEHSKALFALLFPVFAGREATELFKMPGEVIERRKANRVCHLADMHAAVAKQELCVLDACFDQIADGRLAEGLLINGNIKNCYFKVIFLNIEYAKQV